MKQIVLIVMFLSLNSFNKSLNVQKQNNLKQMLQGSWKLNTDSNYILNIKNSIIERKYKGKVTEKNKVKYVFEKSPEKYLTKKGAFDFSQPTIVSDFKIVEYDSLNQVSSSSFIIYIDKQNLELGFETGRASFKKIK
ncbi:hypothetical protein [Flavobacterium wongokense]|uniref:hypothetical protein n=1 Tax=Flavobacterium wongokense TaxID=2910674 RepID=UPI001F1DDC26|nr:hypothetical protein [Flavobacterium sp. WG47]MCF6133549.1 hypothetical protein [Flavobacterium sp. WG47]